MKPSFHDPEARAILEDRKRQRDNEWLLGQIGEAAYLRSLLILGYSLEDGRRQLEELSR